jgi:hypothetical protein
VIAKAAGVATRDRAYEAIECSKSIRATGAIGGDPHTLLKFAQRLVGLWTEPSIRTPRRKSEFVKPPLQLANIVTDDHVTGPVGQHSVAKLPARFVESRKGFRPDYAVDRDSAFLLESTNCKIKVVGECISRGLDVPAQVGQPGTYFRDGRTGVAVTQDHGGGAQPYR